MVSSAHADDSRLTLNAFLGQVVQANPSLEAAKSRADAASHRVKPQSTLDDPFIAAGIDEMPFGGGDGSVTRFQISQAIPFPGKLSARGDAAERRADAASSDADTAQRMLTVIATQAFYRTYFNSKQISLNEDIRRYIRQAIESTKARYRAGGESHHEWLLGKVELGILDAERLRLGREQRSLHALLNELRDQPTETSIKISEPEFSTQVSFKDLSKQALTRQPELRAAQTAKEAAEADERAAKLSYFPDLVIQGMAMKPRMTETGESMGPGNWGVMVGINLPIFFWRKQSEQVSAAQSEQNAAEAEKRSLENRLNTELVDAGEQLKTAQDVVALYEKDVIPNTEIAAKNARSGYAAKRLPLNQLIETLRVERTQKLELLAARMDVELARTRLENLLSSPPIARFAPSRPTVFGGGGMGDGMGTSSSTVNMGSGMSGPTRKDSKGNRGTPSSGGGMGNM